MTDDGQASMEDLLEENRYLKDRLKRIEEEAEFKSSMDLPYHEMVLQSISDAFFTLDEGFRFVHFNNMSEKLLNRKREEVLGKHIFDEAFPEAKGSVFQKKYQCALEKRESLSFETYFGMEPYDNWYNVRVYPLTDGIAVFFTITTKEKEKTRKLEAANSELSAANQKLKSNELQLKAANQKLTASEQQLRAANQQLSANEQQLKATNQQLIASDEQLRKHLHDLNERVKELSCIHAIAEIVEEEGLAIERILERTVKVIPPSWQFPDIACSRIVLDEKEYRTEGFDESEIKMVEPILVDGKVSGSVEVHYSSKPPTHDGQPFLKEEEKLIYLIAERLGKVITRIRAQKELELRNLQLDASNQQLKANEQQLKASNQQLSALNQQLRSNEQQLKASNQQLDAMNQQLRSSEAALKKSKERFDLAMKASRDGLYDWDLITNEIYYSPGWKRMLGYQDDELPNDFSVWEDLTDPEDVKRSWKMQQELVNGDRDRFEMEFRMRHKDGHWVDILSRADIVFDEDGRARRIVGTHVDITENKEYQKEIENAKEEVEFYMDLLGHDLGNIHQGISGSLQMLQQKIDTDKMNMKILELAGESVNNATTLTKEVVLLSRLRDREPEMEDLHLKEVLEDIIEQMRATFSDREMNMEMEDIDHEIRAEPLIREVFINILHNAIRLQDEGPWMRIYAKKKKDRVQVSVEDRGPGIPDSMKTDLFKRFGLKGEKMRRGLGLSIAKVLVERYGGDISIEDRVKGDHSMGARFVVEIPSA